MGCPAGAMVACSAELAPRLRRIRKVLGGGMRQVGVLAAAGLVALNGMIDRLADDHHNAQRIARAIIDMNCPFVHVDLSKVSTNIIYIHYDTKIITGFEFVRMMQQVTEEEVMKFGFGVVVRTFWEYHGRHSRIVTHCDVATAEDIDLVIGKLQFVIQRLIAKFGITNCKSMNGHELVTNGHQHVTNGVK